MHTEYDKLSSNTINKNPNQDWTPSWNLKQKYSKPRKLINESFHEVIGPILVFGQLFCLMPITGVLGDIEHVKFKWKSFRNFFSLFFLFMCSFELMLIIRQLSSQKFSVTNAGTLLFFLISLCGATLLYSLSRRWGKFIRYWRAQEDRFLREPYNITGIRLKTKVKWIVIIISFLACIEHCLYFGSTVFYDARQIEICKLKSSSLAKYVYTKERGHIFWFFSYHWTIIIPLQWLTLTTTFCWNYVDILIIVISLGLSTRFNQINSRLISNDFNAIMPEPYWLGVRLHYIELIELLKRVDQEISLIILLSCSSNLFYICYQLYNSFSDIPLITSKIYFWYSIIYLIIRTLCVILFAAGINDASKKPLAILRGLPTYSYGLEVQRFVSLVTLETIGLTGRKFFYLTRKIILTMMGTIITYELVLLDQMNPEPEKSQICNITRPITTD